MLIENSNQLNFPMDDGTMRLGSELTLEEKKQWIIKNQGKYLYDKGLVEELIRDGMTTDIFALYNTRQDDPLVQFITLLATTAVYEFIDKMVDTEMLEEHFN